MLHSFVSADDRNTAEDLAKHETTSSRPALRSCIFDCGDRVFLVLTCVRDLLVHRAINTYLPS
jgi:hypothetical protein